jgi:hypothetical protein
MSLQQFYQQMIEEEEQFFYTSINNVTDAFEYFGVEKILSLVVDKHPSFLKDLQVYVKKQKTAIDFNEQ